MAEDQINEDNTKYIGVRINKKLYWKIRERLLKRRLTISEALVKGLLTYLDLDPEEDYLPKDK